MRTIEMRQLLARLISEDDGQDLIEYALIAAIVALSGVAVLRNLKNNVANVFNSIGTTLTNAI